MPGGPDRSHPAAGTPHCRAMTGNVTYGAGVAGRRRAAPARRRRGWPPRHRAGHRRQRHRPRRGRAPRRSPSIPTPTASPTCAARPPSAGVTVECHHGELADLGFAPSGTIDLVVSNHTLDGETDLDRTLRQVHRVLKPGAPFVLAMAHPFAAVGPRAPRLRRRPPHGRRPAHRARPGELPHRGVPRARRRGRPPGPDDARREGPQARLLTGRDVRRLDAGRSCSGGHDVERDVEGGQVGGARAPGPAAAPSRRRASGCTATVTIDVPVPPQSAADP